MTFADMDRLTGWGEFCDAPKGWEGPPAGGVKGQCIWGQEGNMPPRRCKVSDCVWLVTGASPEHGHRPSQQPSEKHRCWCRVDLGFRLGSILSLDYLNPTTVKRNDCESDRKANLCVLISLLPRDQTCKARCDNSCLWCWHLGTWYKRIGMRSQPRMEWEPL